MAIARYQVVQGLLDLFKAPSYLEIGVNKGETFHAVKATKKVAVDPKFLFEANARDQRALYCETTSDHYFGSLVAPDDRFHVIYLDGLHTAEQTFRDFINAVDFLHRDGVILIDDVRPNTHIAAISDLTRFRRVRQHLKSKDNSWMGDVYRVVYMIDSFAQQFSVKVVADNHGQAVVWRQPRQQVPKRSIAEAGSKTFDDLIFEQPFQTAAFNEILEEIRKQRQPVT